MVLIEQSHQSEKTSSDWRQEANCLGSSNSLFFSPTSDDKEFVKAFCGSCAVKQECLEYAVSVDEKFGIWGGVDFSEPRERKIARAALLANKKS